MTASGVDAEPDRQLLHHVEHRYQQQQQRQQPITPARPALRGGHHVSRVGVGEHDQQAGSPDAGPAENRRDLCLRRSGFGVHAAALRGNAAGEIVRRPGGAALVLATLAYRNRPVSFDFRGVRRPPTPHHRHDGMLARAGPEGVASSGKGRKPGRDRPVGDALDRSPVDGFMPAAGSIVPSDPCAIASPGSEGEARPGT